MATERLIRVKDAEDAINRIGNQVKTARGMRVAALMSLCGVPTVDAKPVAHGEWLFGELDVLGSPVKCSNCGWGVKNADPILWMNYPGHKFCGNCGADMRGEENGN